MYIHRLWIGGCGGCEELEGVHACVEVVEISNSWVGLIVVLDGNTSLDGAKGCTLLAG